MLQPERSFQQNKSMLYFEVKKHPWHTDTWALWQSCKAPLLLEIKIWTNFCRMQKRKPLYNQLQVFSGGRLVVAVFNWCWVAFEVEVWRVLLIWGSEQNLLCFSTMLILPRLPHPVLTRRLSPTSRYSKMKISFVVLHKRPPPSHIFSHCGA